MDVSHSKYSGPLRFSKLLVAIAILYSGCSIAYANDLRSDIIGGSKECITYSESNASFSLSCDREWTGNHDYISLRAYEIFDGNGYTIELGDLDNFDGLFEIDDSVSAFAEAPLIRHLHTHSGQLSKGAGFIVRKKQRFFIVDSCSSSGRITGGGGNENGGGICGFLCGANGGEISILNSASSGDVDAQSAGGIGGAEIGKNGTANITNCRSSGAVLERNAGGICGVYAGKSSGKVYITHSYSTGNLQGYESGGIIGGEGAYSSGYVLIKECYSEGNITGKRSGGITGDETAQNGGELDILDCYSRGKVEGKAAGGICGADLQNNVHIRNTYASGHIIGKNAGGIISSMAQSGDVTVKYSVYNGRINDMVGDGSITVDSSRGNSHNITDIQGKLYHVDGESEWSDQVWAIRRPDELPVLRFQLPTPSPTQSPTPTITSSPSPSRTPTNSRTSTSTPTNSMTSSYTATPSETSTRTTTPTFTPTPSETASRTKTPTVTSTPSKTSTRSGTATSSITATRTSSETVTYTNTPTASTTASHTSTNTATVTMTRTPTRTSTSSNSPTSRRTETPTATRTASHTSSSTASVTLTRTPSHTHKSSNSPTTTASHTSSSTATVTLTRTPTHTRTSSISPSSSWTATSTVTPSETMTASESYTPTPTGSPTQSSTSSVTSSPSESFSSTSSISPSSTRRSSAIPSEETVDSFGPAAGSFTSTLRISLSSMLAVPVVLLVIYIGYRRRNNETEAKECNDPRSMYAKQLGIPVGSLKLMSTLESTSSRSQFAPARQVKTHPVTGKDKDQVSIESSEVKTTNPLEDMKLAHINPLASTPQAARATGTQSDTTRETVSPMFSFGYGKTSRRNISPHAHSGIHEGLANARQSAVADSAIASSQEAPSAPLVVLVDAKAQSDGSSGSVRIVSPKAPTLQSGEKSDSGNVKQVAVAADLNTAELRRRDRARLQLRQWKAKLLAEPSPLVEVDTGRYGDAGFSETSSGSTDARRASLDQINVYSPCFGHHRGHSESTTSEGVDHLSGTTRHRPSGSRLKFSPQRSRRGFSAA